MTKVTPTRGNVLVKPIEEKLASGIVVPDTVDKERPQKGKVVALGDNLIKSGQEIPFNVKVGDTILFKKYSIEEIKVDNKDHLIMSEENILAIIN